MDAITAHPLNALIKLLADQAVRDHLSENADKKQQDNQNQPNHVLHNQVKSR